MPKGFGGSSFMSQPGSLEGSFNAGRQNYEDRGKYDSDMATANLERMLAQSKEDRAVQEQPFKLQDLQSQTANRNALTEGQNLQNKYAPDKEQREKEKHGLDMAEKQADDFGAIGAEMEMLPEGMRVAYAEKRLGNTEHGRKMIEGIKQGIAEGKTTARDMPDGFRKMQQRVIEGTRAYQQAKMTAEANGDARVNAAQVAADSRVNAAEIRAGAAQAAAATRVEGANRINDARNALIRERDEEKRKHELGKLERQHELRMKLEKAKADAKDGGKGGGTLKTFQQLSVQLEAAAQAEEDPVKRAALQRDADDAFNRATSLAGAGKQQTDAIVEQKPGGGMGIGQAPRTPAPPARGGQTASGTVMPSPKTREEAMALPPGTRFMDPNGKVRTRP